MKIKTIFLLLVLSMVICWSFSPYLVIAQAGTKGRANGEITTRDGDGGGPVSGTKLPNPLGENVVDPTLIIGNVIKAVLAVVGSLALAVFIYGGLTWVISAGNEEKVKKGKDMIMWAAFGLAVIFASYALVSFMIGALSGAS